MPAPIVTHPTHDTLAAFGSGRLSDTEAESVAQHLDECPPCRQQAAALSGDSFVARLKAARPTAPLVPPELADLRDYRVERLLGQGGMGAVYLARNLVMDRPEVLKVVNTAFLRRPGALERFQQEVRNAARLQHPNIVTAYSCPRLGDLLVFAMEYVDGKDLAQVVKEGGPLPVAHACYYAQQVARGLQHAHKKGMVHRDVKPANLMLAKDGKQHVVKVLDFGLAKMVWDGGEADGGDGDGPANPGLTGAGRMLGTPDYISPEQTLDAARADIRADIYSLGCTLYFLLTGRPPFSGQSLAGILEAHHKTEARPLNLVRADVPAELATIVAKMMAKDPARRYQTPLEVALALAPFVQGGGKAPPPAPEPSTADGPARGAGDTPTLRKSSGSSPAIASPPVVVPIPQPNISPIPAVAPAPEEWTDLVTEPDAPAVRPTRRTKRKGPPIGLIAAGAVGVLLLGLVIAWAAGVFRVQTRDGTIVLENLPPDADVLVDGEKVTVSRNGDEARVSLAKGGTHGLKVVLGGREIHASDVKLTLGAAPIRVRLEKPVAARPAANPDRPAAEWILSLGGTLAVSGKPGYIGSATSLPTEPFTVLRVNLANNPIVSDAGLAHLKDCKALAYLSLDGTRVSDDGLIHLKAYKALAALYLSGTRITDAGLVHLKDCRALASLHLSDTPVTDAGLAHLKGCPALTFLGVSKTQVTARGVADFRAAVPRCEIEHDGD